MPRKNGKGGGGSAHDRAMARAKTEQSKPVPSEASLAPLLPTSVKVPFFDSPRLTFPIAALSLFAACVLTFLGVRLKNLSVLLVVAWIISIPAVLILCQFLPRHRNVARIVTFVVLAVGLYLIDIYNPPPAAEAGNKQVFVENQGTIGTLNQSGNSFIGTPPPGSPSGPIVHTGGNNGTLTVEGMNACYLGFWKCVLAAVEKHSGNKEAIETDVRFLKFHSNRAFKNGPSDECRQEIDNAAQIITANAVDESR
ncbi:MAG: hypothetical protein ACLQKY_13200, partial [Terracidiphilus sp.]